MKINLITLNAYHCLKIALSIFLGAILIGSSTHAESIEQAGTGELLTGQATLFNSLDQAWLEAASRDKVVMLVIGSESCDRCALLKRYMQDQSLSERIDKHFVKVDISTTALMNRMPIVIDDAYLPAIILVESDGQFSGELKTDSLLTFRPEVYEPLYDWMENLLFYSDQVFASFNDTL